MVAVLAVLIPRAVSRTPVAPEPNVIAVAPFGVRGAGIGLWSEGLVEYLSRSLDGAGELRTVSPSVFLRRWSGRADPASARELGGRTGARLVVFGSLVQGARDSVRGRATLLDVVTGQSLAEVDVSGDTLAIDRMADSLGVSLLRELGRARPVAAVRNAPLGGASLPAIKEFLRGEQYYRRGHYDSALAHHARAVALDSSFALAYRRISLDLSWGPPTSGAFEPIGAYAFKAAALNRGLTMRESMLIAADSCFYAAFDASAPDHATLRHRLFTLLNEAARRFPGDPEVWQAIGEARFHHLFEAGYHHGGPPLQSFGTPSDVLQAFETAIALDPGFTPAYEHVFEVATISGHAHLAQRYARTYLTLNAADAHATSLRLAAQLLDPARSTSPEIARLIDTLAAGPLLYAAFRLGAWPDSAETAVRLLRALPNGRRSVAGIMPVWADTLMWPQYLATSLLYRGHLREAHKLYRPLISRPNPNRWAWFRNPLLDLALLNAVPTDTAVARIARSLEPDVLASRGFWPPHWLPWWFARRDTAELHRIIQQTDRTARRTTRPLERWRASYLQTAAAGYLALLRGDSLAAVRHFDALPDTTCSWIECSLDKLTLARLLAARGEDRRASELLDQWLWNAPSPFFVLARLERARIAERVGDRDLASRWYQFVADAWRHADPELQSYVDEARQGVRRLGGEPRP
ncbi:MAG TPA: hypothetical protein VFU41_08920 [Gemmatimonadales bacterium]|nr:hypothetical protein [Gemmatimonadales bacterium]